MADLTTLDNVKAWLATDGQAFPDTDDTLLSRLITSVSGFIEAFLNRTIASTSYTWIGAGTGSARLLLPNYPVQTVASVTVDGKTIPASGGYGQTGYQFDDFGLWLIGSIFTRGVRNVQVAYTAGYAATPKELEQACISTVALRYRERERIGHASKSFAGETVAFTIVDFPKEVQTILRNYRKVVPV